MIFYCENCELKYNSNTSDTGRCPLCSKSVKQYFKKPKYCKGNPKKVSIRAGVNNLIKGSADKAKGKQDWFLNNIGIGKRKVGRQPL